MAKRQPLPRPVAVREVLKGLMKPLDWDNLGNRSLIRQVWEGMVPPPLLAHTRLLEIRRRELWVEVSAATWGQELQFLKPSILKELEQVFGPGVIRDLRFRIGSGK